MEELWRALSSEGVHAVGHAPIFEMKLASIPICVSHPPSASGFPLPDVVRRCRAMQGDVLST